MCDKCKAYFERHQCGKNIGNGECDCPKCQGLCTDEIKADNADERERERRLVFEFDVLNENGSPLPEVVIDRIEKFIENELDNMEDYNNKWWIEMFPN